MESKLGAIQCYEELSHVTRNHYNGHLREQSLHLCNIEPFPSRHSVKQEKKTVAPLQKESVYDFNDSDDDGLVVDENPPVQSRRSYQRAVAVPATPALPPISTFSSNASMGNFAAAAAAAAAAGSTSMAAVTDHHDSKQGSLKLRLSCERLFLFLSFDSKGAFSSKGEESAEP